MRKIITLYIIIYSAFVSSDSFGQGGTLDTLFGNKGVAICSIGTSNSLALQNDKKIIAGGISINSKFTLARFDSTGALDNTFGNNGAVEKLLGSGHDNNCSIALQSDGKIVLGGSCINTAGNWSFVLARFDSIGKLDTAFNGSGILFTSFNSTGYADYGYALTVQTDGKITQVGFGQDNTGSDFVAIVRYNPNGTLDNSFGIGGKVMTIVGGPGPFPSSIIVQPDGKILVGGNSSYSAPSSFILLRYDTHGILDNSFGIGGKTSTYFGSGGSSGNLYDDDEAFGMALQPDGKILLLGQSYLGTDTFTALALARYNADGSLDNTFGANGKVRTHIPNQLTSSAGYAAFQSDGKIIVSGSSSNTQSGYDSKFTLLRYDSNGGIDTSFGSNGIIIKSFVDFPNSAGEIIMLSEDKFLVGGGGGSVDSQYGYICKFLTGLNTGLLTFSVKKPSILIYPNPIQSEATLQYTLIQNENLDVTLYDMQGRLVQIFFTDKSRTMGEHMETLCLAPTLATGNYILRISNGKSSQGIKIIKE